jgi:hypothetical protein
VWGASEHVGVSARRLKTLNPSTLHCPCRVAQVLAGGPGTPAVVSTIRPQTNAEPLAQKLAPSLPATDPVQLAAERVERILEAVGSLEVSLSSQGSVTPGGDAEAFVMQLPRAAAAALQLTAPQHAAAQPQAASQKASPQKASPQKALPQQVTPPKASPQKASPQKAAAAAAAAGPLGAAMLRVPQAPSWAAELRQRKPEAPMRQHPPQQQHQQMVQPATV